MDRRRKVINLEILKKRREETIARWEGKTKQLVMKTVTLAELKKEREKTINHWIEVDERIGGISKLRE